MMLGLQGSTSTPKVYRCVACSATFTGLASLLVHQATHAGSLSKIPAPSQPHISQRETLFGSMDSFSEHPSPPTLLPDSCHSPSFFICDCGEEFQDFSLMLQHKRLHASQLQLLQPLDSNSVLSSGTVCDKVFPSQHVSFIPTVTPSSLVLSCPSTSRFPDVKPPMLADHKSNLSPEDVTSIATAPQGQCKPPQDPSEKQLETMSAPAEQPAETVDNNTLLDKTNSVLLSKKGESLSINKPLMKLLASAYMNRFQNPVLQNQNNNTVIPKQEVVPVDITPVAKTEVSSINDVSITQLRRLLEKPGIKTKAPSISKILDGSKKRVVSLTKTFSPVVVLETRQKLMTPFSNGTYGEYQCGRCRRVFQNLDKLTEHHFLHKKERIKCCRRCKQLIIGRLPLPDNHVCPQLGNKTMLPSGSFPQKIVPFHSLNNSKKVFFCPLCKHNYARRWNLKMHKCQGPGLAPFQKRPVLRSNSEDKTDAGVKAVSQANKSVAVGTEVTRLSHIKVEATSPNSLQSAVSELAWTHPAKSVSPFYSKSSMNQAQKDVGMSLHQGQENSSWDAAGAECDEQDSDEGEWTMPLDDELAVLGSTDKAGNDTQGQSTETTAPSLRYFVRGGVRRYPCNRCQKTYSRPSTLRRHLRLCGFRLRGPATLSGGQGAAPLTGNNTKPMFACFVCGKTFNRKDNMMVHRKRCQLLRTTEVSGKADGRTEQPAVSDRQSKEDDGGNWGIMSLPSVLPRRVTCECGVGFTSPRLLLEHLQKHAQESYTCPTCGETVNSWADYEVHLQIHMHPQHQLLKGIQPQRSQPLLLRFQQQPSGPVDQIRPKQARTVQALNPAKKKPQRIMCTRCNNTFATRCSLRRHLLWNRCKGVRDTNQPKTYHCSHCNSDFPNSISLMFHQRSGACKPAIKPVRCPICLRWFGTVDGLQKHLLTHKQNEAHRCDVCQGTYPNVKSLKNHRRRIHRIMAGDTAPNS